METRPAAKKPPARAAKKAPAPLTPALRRELRARAHHLHPIVAIGQQGLTPRVLHELDVALTAHGLVKLRVFADDRTLREAFFMRICAELACAPVQHLGKLLILWRPPDDPPVPAKSPAKSPAAVRDAARAVRPDAAHPTRRRGRATGAPTGVPRATMPRRRRAR